MIETPNRRFAAVLLVVGLLVVNLSLNLYSLYDRWEIKRQARLNRTMLDARARIQITIINTGHRRGAFTQEEIKAISDDWDLAEYNLAQSNPFLETK